MHAMLGLKPSSTEVVASVAQTSQPESGVMSVFKCILE